jgi:hypothetical protein
MATSHSAGESENALPHDNTQTTISDQIQQRSVPSLTTGQSDAENGTLPSESDRISTAGKTSDISTSTNEEADRPESTVAILEDEVRTFKGIHRIIEPPVEKIKAEIETMSLAVVKAYSELKMIMNNHETILSQTLGQQTAATTKTVATRGISGNT